MGHVVVVKIWLLGRLWSKDGILDQTSQRYQKEIQVRSSVARSPGSQFVDDSMLPSNSEFGDSELPSIELLVNDLRRTQGQPLVILPPCHKSIIV